MAVMVVFSMVAYWNDWFTALIYLPGEENAPLPLVLRNILIKSSASASQASMLRRICICNARFHNILFLLVTCCHWQYKPRRQYT